MLRHRGRAADTALHGAGLAGREGDRLASLGYREVETVSDTVFGPAGTRLRGHEFHYSALAAEPGGKPLFAAKDLRGNVRPAGSARGNVCGSYIHLYFGSNPAAAAAFAEGMRR